MTARGTTTGKMKRDQLIAEIKDLLKSFGFEERRPGAFYKDYSGKLYRYLFKETSLRKEAQCIVPATEYSKESKFWARVSSAYYKNLSIEETRPGHKQLCGMSVKGC